MARKWKTRWKCLAHAAEHLPYHFASDILASNRDAHQVIDSTPVASGASSIPSEHGPVDDLDESDKLIVKTIRKQYFSMWMLRNNYHRLWNLILFLVLYLSWTWEQKGAYSNRQVVASIEKVFPPRDDTNLLTKTMHNVDDVMYWLGKQVDSLWKDPFCGDGVCEPPHEFPALGELGCKADCGVAQEAVKVILKLEADFTARTIKHVRSADIMGKVAWNLCLVDTQRIKAGLENPCLYRNAQKFKRVKQTITRSISLVAGE
ncbi:hypothetical protein CYMTET_2566 [Cymbomonas tetramitiformis]|uniref:Uncharacterized protein n=1 Tax=Cymbomonas tetramitiformis TaxID=36881 RepID=A0AAE0H4W6_9CHLO|nr:hypothetical protein CYMTET_6664 [Cymbomonas tetramitiformis]KAK3289963.1 hypothetical protein CYMTET_2566 [Cymbomonas tetramitiformis]